MKKQRSLSGRSSAGPAAAKSKKSEFSKIPLLVFGAGAALLVWLIISSVSPPKTETEPSTPAAKDVTTATNVPPLAGAETAAAAPAKELSAVARQKLLGNWQRTDAEYQISIRNVRADGSADAEYLNPRPIHVARSAVVEADAELGFFMELQDVGYPGSTYTLQYDAANDTLAGVYYQAAMQQSYEVVFARQR